MAKKSYCVTCANDSCADVGKNNSFFSGSNLCSRHVTQQELSKKKQEEDEEKTRQDIEDGIKKFAEELLNGGIFPYGY